MRALERDREKRYPTAKAMQEELEELASRYGLFLAASKLENFMERTFAAKIKAWRSAQARGLSLADHLERSYEILSEEDASPRRLAAGGAPERKQAAHDDSDSDDELPPGKLRPHSATRMDDRHLPAVPPPGRAGSLAGAALGALLAMIVILLALYIAGAPPATASAPPPIPPVSTAEREPPIAPPPSAPVPSAPPPSMPAPSVPAPSVPATVATPTPTPPTPAPVAKPTPAPAPAPAPTVAEPEATKPRHHHGSSGHAASEPLPLSDLPRMTPYSGVAK